MSDTRISDSGDGTRPATRVGVDNIGTAPSEDLREAAIGQTACEGYRRRERDGGGVGSEEQDWLHAEQEVGRKANATSPANTPNSGT